MVTCRNIYRYAYPQISIHTCISSICHLKGPRNNLTPQEQYAHPAPRSWLLTPFSNKGLPGEMADSETRAGCAQDEPGAMVVVGCKEVVPKNPQ